MKISILKRLKKKTVIDSNGCWLWQGCRTPFGYGQIYYQGKVQGVHVVSAKIHFKDFNLLLITRHKCDVPNCWNPEHLIQGTNGDNRKDAVDRGRWKNQNSKKTHCKRGHELIAENLMKRNDNRRSCKICWLDNQRIRRAFKCFTPR